MATTNYNFVNFLKKLTEEDQKMLLDFLTELSGTPVINFYEKLFTFDDGSAIVIGKNGVCRPIDEKNHVDFSAS